MNLHETKKDLNDYRLYKNMSNGAGAIMMHSIRDKYPDLDGYSPHDFECELGLLILDMEQDFLDQCG